MVVAINNNIKVKRSLVIGSDGTQLGDLLIKDALILAETEGLDLVQVSEGSKNVCKIMNHSKNLYDQKKKLKASNENRIKLKTKEIQLSANIGDHDLQVKVNHTLKHLSKGHKVMVVLNLKGRENANKNYFKTVLERFKEKCSDVTVEQDIKIEGKRISMILTK